MNDIDKKFTHVTLKREDYDFYEAQIERMRETIEMQKEQIQLLKNIIENKNNTFESLTNLNELLVQKLEKRFETNEKETYEQLKNYWNFIGIMVEDTKDFKEVNDYLILLNKIAMHLKEYALLEKVFWEHKKEQEHALYPLFNENIHKIIKDVKVVSIKNLPNHHPDSWIKIGNDNIPVEIKKHAFNEKALKQLQRYIDVYKSNKGIAVGSHLTVELPDNITFISISELEKANEL